MTKRARSFEIVDMETQNSIASYSDRRAALEALQGLIRDEPSAARTLSLVEFDGDGHAISALPADELAS